MHWFEQETSYRQKAKRSERQVMFLVITVACALGAVLILGARGILSSQAEHREVRRSAQLERAATDVKIRIAELTEWERNFSASGPVITSVASRATFMTTMDHLYESLRLLRASTNDREILAVVATTESDYDGFLTVGERVLNKVGKPSNEALRSTIDNLRDSLVKMNTDAAKVAKITDARRLESARASNVAAVHANRLFVAAGVVAGLLLITSGWLGFRVVRIHRFALEQMATIAATDPLTGLANRRTWDHRLPEEFLRTARTGNPVTIAMFDLDKFKSFNDTHGHGAGDELLRGVASAFKGVIRSTDLAARLGGEEFGIMFFNSEPQACLTAIDAIRLNIPSGQTFSVGLAQWDGSETPIEVTVRADQALYAAKESGRNRAAISAENGEPLIVLPMVRNGTQTQAA